MKPILLTYGMGIGPEIALKALARYSPSVPVRLSGRKESLERANQKWQVDLSNVLFFDDDSEPAEVASIRHAAQQCLVGQASAMVTGPIHKQQLVAKGFAFSGHTDFLGHLCGERPTVMSFVGGELRMCLVTTHIPLMQVGAALSVQRIVETVCIADRDFRSMLGLSARFAVCGLNPHAGEGGVLGREEIEIIAPACDELRDKGLSIVGPVSAETAFLLARQKSIDVVVAMYHDQGLAPLKVLDFGRSVNWTLGLPIVRTSVDHGTADHLVGTGQADESSLIAALRLAEQIVQYRR